MAYTETLFIYKDTYLLCKLLLKYSKNVSRIIRYGAYETMTSKACTLRSNGRENICAHGSG